MNSDKVNAIIVLCLEHAAESHLPPAAASADFLKQVLATPAFTVEEVNEATLRISRIIRGIAGRQPHEHAL